MKNKLYFIYSVFLLMILNVGCEKFDIKWNLQEFSTIPKLESTLVNISNTGATIDVVVLSDGGDPLITRGVCYSINPNPSITSSVVYNTSGLMTFSSVLTDLSPNTIYYVRGFASNSNGVSYSDEIIFTTTNISVVLPTVTTNTPSSISANSVTCSSTIVANGGSAITNSGFCYGTNQFPNLTGSHTVGGLSSGTFTSVISNLTSNTTYYVRAYATNSVGTTYGNQISFTTISNVASNIGNNDCSSLSGINSLYYGYNGTSDVWGIDYDMAYNGGCFIAPNPNNFGNLGSTYGSNHFVEFNKNFNSQGYMEFWVNTYNPGQNNLIPTIIINGNSIGNAIMIGGAANSFSWMKVRTPIIPAGFNNIKISFNATYIPLRVDEVSFYEY